MSASRAPTLFPPIALARVLARRGGRLGLLVDLAFASWLIWIFDAINNLAAVRQRLAEHNGRSVLSFEQALHLAPERALDSWLAARSTLSSIVVFWYENVHIIVTLVMLGLLWWRRPEILRSSQATLAIANLVALAVFWTFPVAPPRMLPGYVDLVAVTKHLPPWRVGAVALHANQLCSMPSLHIAWASWSAIAVWRLTGRRWLRALAVIYPFVTTFAVMATGNHYLADAVVGAAIAFGAFFAQRRLAARRKARRQDAPIIDEGVTA